LGLTLDSGLDRAITDCLELLGDVPAARLFDEVLKLFHHGHAVRSWDELRSHNLVQQLFAQTAAAIDHADGKAAEDLILMALENTDRRIQQGKPVIPAFLFAVLLWRPFVHELDRQQQSGQPLNDLIWISGDAVFRLQSRQVAVPRRVSGTVVEIWEMQFRLEQRQPKMVQRLLASKRFRAAYDFLVLRQRIGEVEQELTQWWTEIQECNADQRHYMIEQLRGEQTSAGDNPPKRKRRRRKNKGAGNTIDQASA
jgi:poly(A) polymerase